MHFNGNQKENENNINKNRLGLANVQKLHLIDNSAPNRMQGFNIGQLLPPPMLNLPPIPAMPEPVRLNNAQEQQPVQGIKLIQALEDLLNTAPQIAPAINSQHLIQIRPQNQLQQKPQDEENENVLANLQIINTAIKKREKRQQMLQLVRELTNINAINDNRILDAWYLYLDIVEDRPPRHKSGKREVKLLFDYIDRTGHVKPDSNDVLECLRQYRDENNISIGTSDFKLIALKRFFNWTKAFNIYPNITQDLSIKDLRQIHGEEEADTVQILRRNARLLLENHDPDTVLNPNVIKTYLRTHPHIGMREFEELKNFARYISGFNIQSPTTRTVTQFMISQNMRAVLNSYSAISKCVHTFRNFFEWTSTIRDEHHNILYPNIGKYLDKIIWIDCLLLRIDPRHKRNKQQDEFNGIVIDSLMNDLGIDAHGNHIYPNHPQLQ